MIKKNKNLRNAKKLEVPESNFENDQISNRITPVLGQGQAKILSNLIKKSDRSTP